MESRFLWTNGYRVPPALWLEVERLYQAWLELLDPRGPQAALGPEPIHVNISALRPNHL
jgi:hypothetical protein